jgi:transposase
MPTWESLVEAQALRAQGWSISAIARHLDVTRLTVRRYLTGERRPASGPGRRWIPSTYGWYWAADALAELGACVCIWRIRWG